MKTNRYTVWDGYRPPCRIDRICDTLVQAKKHAAWLKFSGGGANNSNPPYITDCLDPERNCIDYSDFQFIRGESRRVKK